MRLAAFVVLIACGGKPAPDSSEVAALKRPAPERHVFVQDKPPSAPVPAVQPAPPANDVVLTDVLGLEDAVQLAASSRSRTCARRANGRVTCWGDWFVQANWSKPGYDRVPVVVPGVTTAIDIFVSDQNACARLANGRTACWGRKGVGSATIWKTATDVPALAGVTELAGSGAIACGVRNGKMICPGLSFSDDFHPVPGSLRTWDGGGGRDRWRCTKTKAHTTCQQLWYRKHDQGWAPDPRFGSLDDVVDMTLPTNTVGGSCVVRSSGIVQCRGPFEEPGYETVAGLTDAIAIAAGFAETCALQRSGGVTCWQGSLTPTASPKLDDAVQIVGGGVHFCVRRKSGKVSCWGMSGLLGDGSSGPFGE